MTMTLGTILPTRASLAADDRYHADVMARRAATVRELGIDRLPHGRATMPEYTRYELHDGTWLEVGRDCKVRQLARLADGGEYVRALLSADKVRELVG